MTAPSVLSVKEQAKRLVESLDDQATWEDLVYWIYLQESVERGRQDIREGRTTTTQELRSRLGLAR